MLLALIGVGILLALGLSVFYGLFMLGLVPATSALQDRLGEVIGRIQRDEQAKRSREGMAELAEARSELARIELDIAHNHQVVKLH